MPKALAIAGWSGAGKTTLITALIPCLIGHGLRVSSIKHGHHDVALDQPGKDSHRHAQAGAAEVIFATPAGFALFGRGTPDLAALLARFAPVDLVLVEGFRQENIPRLEVYRPALGKPRMWPEQTMLAVASDTALPDCPLPVLPLDDVDGIARFLIAALALHASETRRMTQE